MTNKDYPPSEQTEDPYTEEHEVLLDDDLFEIDHTHEIIIDEDLHGSNIHTDNELIDEQYQNISYDLEKVDIIIKGLLQIVEIIKIDILTFDINKESNSNMLRNLTKIELAINKYEGLISQLNNYHLIELLQGILDIIGRITTIKSDIIKNLENDDIVSSKRNELDVLFDKFNFSYSLINKAIKSIDFGKKSLLSSELIKHSPLVEFFWNYDKDWSIDRVSQNVTTLTGYTAREFYSGNINYKDIIHPDDLVRVTKEVEDFTKNKKISEFSQEYKILTKYGKIKYVNDKTLVKYSNNGDIISLYGFIQDISDHYISTFGLPNYKSLQNEMKNEGEKHLILIKIRNIDYINGLLGREAGTELLNEFSKQLNEILKYKGAGQLYQIGNNEYAYYQIVKKEHISNLLFMPLDFIEELNKELAQINIVYDNILPIHFEYLLGATFFDTDPIKHAYTALDISKRQGCPIIYTVGLGETEDDKNTDFLKWVGKLKKALDNPDDYFRIYLQKIRDNKNNDVEKYEALIRYYDKDDTQTIIGPYNFLGHVKKAGLSKQMFTIIVDKIINVLKNTKQNIEISINCSIEDITSNGNIKYLTELTNVHNIDRSRIIIEILEDTTEEQGGFPEIIELKSLGYKIAIDDFGTGSSNFERLLKINPDFIKIDGSFIKNIIASNESFAIVKNIISLAKLLGAKTIAEFVYNEDVRNKMIEMGVDYSQGFYYHEPTNSDEIVKEMEE